MMKKARNLSQQEGEGGEWAINGKSARSTLEVRKNTIFFIEKY